MMSTISETSDYQTRNPGDDQKEEVTTKDDVTRDDEFADGKRLGEWWIERKIAEGEYGKIYLAGNKKTRTFAALKAETNALSALKLEAMILRTLNERGANLHFAEIFTAFKREKYSYMVMTLLGPDLKQLLNKCNGKFTPGTWSRVGMQCLYAIKFLHDHGFVHRHIKPRNFLLGHPTDTERARFVHLIDFGLARQFAYCFARVIVRGERYERWRVRPSRKKIPFRGDVRYTSAFVDRGREHSRMDDIWSLLYMLLEMDGRLPWQSEEDFETVKRMKNKHKDEGNQFALGDCDVYRNLMDVFKNRDYRKKPDYNRFHDYLCNVMEVKGRPKEYETEAVMDDDPLKRYPPPINYETFKYDWEDEPPKNGCPEPAWQDYKFFTTDVLHAESEAIYRQRRIRQGKLRPRDYGYWCYK